MSEDNNTNGAKQKGIITELQIPPELIKSTDSIFEQKQPRFANALSAARVVALLSWVVAVLAILLRLNDSTREYNFTRIVGGGAVSRDESAQRVFILISAAALAISGIGCLAGSILCAKGASDRPSTGRFLLILSVLSLLMAAVLYFFW